MKRFISLALTLFILCSFTACGGSERVDTTTSEIIIGNTDNDNVDGTDDNNTAGSGSNATTGGNTNQSTSDKTNNSQASGNTDSSSGKQVDTVKADLKGATIKIATWNQEYFPSSKGSTSTSKAQYETIKSIEKNLNCKISVTTAKTETISSTLMKNQLSGVKYADIIAVPAYQAASFIAGKNVTDLRTIKSIDLSKSYMNFGNCLENTSVKGKNFFVISEDSSFGSNKGVFFNKNILGELGYDKNYIYTLADQNKWTLSTMRELAKKAVLDKDGKSGLSTADRFGMLVNDAVCSAAEAILSVSGAKIFKNNNGNITYNMDSTEVVNAITLARDVYLNDGSAYATTSNDDEIYKMFMTGHGLFLISGAKEVEYIADMDADFGFVHFPAISGSNYSGIVNWNMASFLIPTGLSATDSTNAGYFLQAYLAGASDVASVRYNEISTRYFRDDTAEKYIKLSNQSQVFEASSMLCSAYSGCWNIHLGTYKVFYDSILNKNAAIKTRIEAAKTSAQAELKEFMAKY